MKVNADHIKSAIVGYYRSGLEPIEINKILPIDKSQIVDILSGIVFDEMVDRVNENLEYEKNEQYCLFNNDNCRIQCEFCRRGILSGMTF